ncbi:MAG: lamin tail domain-containing protein [Planctomycetota bacterium]
MPRKLPLYVVICCLLASPAGAQITISEFMSSNRATVDDGSRTYPDWIELYNRSDETVDLEGWGLSDTFDEPMKWVFPAVSMAPGEFLLIFASGQDRREPGEQLHTSFRLNRSLESVVLSKPGPELVSIHLDYPEQRPDFSYGFAMEITADPVLPLGSTAKYFVPDNSSLDGDWQQPDFDDGAWPEGAMGLGFDLNDPPELDDLIQTDLSEVWQGENNGIFVRVPFELSEEDLAKVLRLSIQYNDGFIAYVNGVEVAARNTGSSRRYTARATTQRSSDASRLFEEVSLANAGNLVAGTNVLAIHALNQSRSNDTALLNFELEKTSVAGIEGVERSYFGQPTPGAPNATGFPGFAEPPTFSVESQAVTAAFDLELSGPEGTVIRYTTDRSTPDINSPVYSEPIRVDGLSTVTALAFTDGLLPSVPEAHSYIFLAANVAGRDSDIPIIIINTFGQAVADCNSSNRTNAHVHIVQPENGRALMVGSPVFTGRAGVKRRGASTCGRQKHSMNLELRDNEGQEQDVRLLDWAPESDYVLYGGYNFDHALMRNVLAYDLSNQAGQWAVKTNYVEVYLNTSNSTTIASNHYWGLYTLMEKIQPGGGRLDISRLEPEENEEPQISSGYVFKRDRNQQGEPEVPAPGACNGSSVVVEFPKTMSSQQRTYLTRILADLNSRLASQRPLESAGPIMDVTSWIDHHILNMMPKNVDAFRLSGFSHVYEGKVFRGPSWDYDRSMGSTDGRDREPRSWANTGGDGGTQYFACGYYGRLFRGPINIPGAGRPPLSDSDWDRLYRERWRELRDGPLSTENILASIDGHAEASRESWPRNFQRWRQGSTQNAAVTTLKNWLSARVAWIDSQFIEPPVLGTEGGDFDAPFMLEMSTSNGTVWYTLNGTDPQNSPDRIEYSGPIEISMNTRVIARSRVGNSVWSGSTEAVYVFERANLIISEVNYHPLLPEGSDFRESDFEFIEIQNAGDEAVNLNGYSLESSSTLSFEFGDTTLEPGAFLVIARDAEALRSAYEYEIPIAGEIARTMSNTRLGLSIEGPVGEVLVEFEYDDDWYPETDGKGPTLVVYDPKAPRDAFMDAKNWRASAEVGGSPGRADASSVTATSRRRPGDLDGDGSVNVSDVVRLLGALFRGEADGLPCGSDISSAGNLAVVDLNADQQADLSDAVVALTFLFQNGDAPAAGLDCVDTAGCEDACSQ